MTCTHRPVTVLQIFEDNIKPNYAIDFKLAYNNKWCENYCNSLLITLPTTLSHSPAQVEPYSNGTKYLKTIQALYGTSKLLIDEKVDERIADVVDVIQIHKT